MKGSYKAMQIRRPGVLELVERVAQTPGDGQVLLRVEACGMGAD
jgi:alcohol dehydrogenase